MKVIQNNEYDEEDDDTTLPPPQMVINVGSERSLEMTLTKKCIEVLNNLSKVYILFWYSQSIFICYIY